MYVVHKNHVPIYQLASSRIFYTHDQSHQRCVGTLCMYGVVCNPFFLHKKKRNCFFYISQTCCGLKF